MSVPAGRIARLRARVEKGLATRRWLLIAALWTLAAVFSAVQIYFRDLAAGVPARWAEVLVANLLAWLPWLVVAIAALRVEARFPIAGRLRWRHAALHAALALSIAALFLLYLAVFHLVYLDGVAWPVSRVALGAEFSDKLGRFALSSVALYGAIVVGGFAERTWRASRAAVGAGAPQEPPQPHPRPLVVRSTGKVETIDPRQVAWIEAEGNYARLHLDGRTVLLRSSLASLAAELGRRRFVRVHRSILVNLRRVRQLKRLSHGDALVVLDDGSELKVSRTYRPALETAGF